MTIQLFDEKIETEKFYNSFLGVFNYLEVQRNRFYDNCYFVNALADFLYGSVPASQAMPIEEWRMSFNHIIQAFNLSGTYETYITMFKGLFGNNALITFEILNPADLKITIDISSGGGASQEDEFITELEDVVTTDELEAIVFIKILEQINDADLQSVLQATTPVGIKVTFDIIRA